MKTAIIALLVGSVGGLIAALAGVGGGIVMVPAFVFALGLDQTHAIATSLAVIVPTAVVASARYSLSNLIDWRIAAFATVGAVLVAFKATEWMKSMTNPTLIRIFGILLIIVGFERLIASFK